MRRNAPARDPERLRRQATLVNGEVAELLRISQATFFKRRAELVALGFPEPVYPGRYSSHAVFRFLDQTGYLEGEPEHRAAPAPHIHLGGNR